MLTYLYHALASFRNAFSRERSWLLFCAVVLSFLAAPEMIGRSTAPRRRNRSTRPRSSESLLKALG